MDLMSAAAASTAPSTGLLPSTVSTNLRCSGWLPLPCFHGTWPASENPRCLRYLSSKSSVSWLQVTHNVAYDNMGHTFFIEDSIETNNEISYNLGLYTKTSLSLLDTDTTPATFWITNPSNYIRHNSAAGSDRYGFWFDLQEHPTGPSATTTICPPGMPLGAFDNNTAHTNGRYGLRIFNFWDPRENPCSWGNGNNFDVSPAAQAVLTNYTGYKNIRTGVTALQIGQVCYPSF